MDNDLGRLKTLSRIVFAILLIITVVLVAITALLIAGAALAFSDPATMDEVGGALFICMLIVAMVLILLVLILFLKITRAIYRDYSPFTLKNVRYLSYAAILYIVMPVAILGMTWAAYGEMLLLEAAITLVPGLFMAAIIYMLALVFRYGCWLQKESDETL